MAKKRKGKKQADPNQLLLFTPEEMEGEEKIAESAPIPKPRVEVKPEPTPQPTPEPTLQSVSGPAPVSASEPKPVASEFIITESSPSTIHLLRYAIKILDSYPPKQQRLIAMQAAALLQSTLDLDGNFHLPAMDNTVIEGVLLQAVAYVGIARSFPNMIDSIGLNWAEEYQKAISEG